MSLNMPTVYTLSPTNVLARQSSENVVVTHNGRKFTVLTGQESHIIKVTNLSSELRGITTETLKNYLNNGYLQVSKFGSDYKIEYMPRLKGGGPFLAWAGYVGVKVICYGVAAAGAAVLLIGTGGGAGAASGAASAAAGGFIAAGAGSAVATGGASVVAGAVAGAGLAPAAATTTASILSSGAGAALTAVESLALLVSAGLAAVPGP